MLEQRFCNGRVSMTERIHGDASPKVEIAFAVDVVQIAAGTVSEDDIEPAIARDHVLLEECLYGREIVPHNGRW